MKTLLSFTGTLALSVLALGSLAQTPTKPSPTPDQRAATYQGPKVVKDTKALGKKMVQKSKPADGRPRLRPAKVQ